MQKIRALALSKFSFMSRKEPKVVVPILTFLLSRGYESKDSMDRGQKISDSSVCLPGTEYIRISISTREESYLMELFQASVTEKKRSGRKQICIPGRRRAGRSDGGTCGRLMPSWKGRWGPRAVLYRIAKGGRLYVTTELSSQQASFYPSRQVSIPVGKFLSQKQGVPSQVLQDSNLPV